MELPIPKALAAALAGCSEKSLEHYIATGKLSGTRKTPGNQVLVPLPAAAELGLQRLLAKDPLYQELVADHERRKAASADLKALESRLLTLQARSADKQAADERAAAQRVADLLHNELCPVTGEAPRPIQEVPAGLGVPLSAIRAQLAELSDGKDARGQVVPGKLTRADLEVQLAELRVAKREIEIRHHQLRPLREIIKCLQVPLEAARGEACRRAQATHDALARHDSLRAKAAELAVWGVQGYVNQPQDAWDLEGSSAAFEESDE